MTELEVPYSSRPIKQHFYQRRLILAVVVSIILHTFFFIYHSEPEQKTVPAPLVLTATLLTEQPQYADDEDRKGKTSDQTESSQTQPSDASNPILKTPSDTVVKTPVPEKTITAHHEQLKNTLDPPDEVTEATVEQTKNSHSDLDKRVKPQEASTSIEMVSNTEATKKDQIRKEKLITPLSKPAPIQKQEKPQAPTNNTEASAKPPETLKPSMASQAQVKAFGEHEEFSNPIEQAYYQVLMAYLKANLPDHPQQIRGQVRLQIKIQFGSVITSVKILQSSNSELTDAWAKRAVLNLSPVPTVPNELEQTYFFRPTLLLTN